jgi:hypothetical protein
MICPNKEKFLSEKRRLKIQMGNLDKDKIPEKMSNRLEVINKRLAEIEKIQKTTDPANGLDDTEYAMMGD